MSDTEYSGKIGEKPTESAVETIIPEKRIHELKNAYQAWSALPKETRGGFNRNWLRQNGFRGLFKWIDRNYDIQNFTKMISKTEPEIGKDFDYQETPDPTTESTSETRLIKAWREWSESDKETRGRFSRRWLQRNGFWELYDWASKNGGIQSLVKKATVSEPKIIDDFIYKEPTSTKPYTQATAEIKLVEAWRKWSESDKETSGKFNSEWLLKGGFNQLNGWAQKHGGIKSLADVVSKIEPKIAEDFDYQEVIEARTAAKAKIELVNAWKKWSESDEKTRGAFKSNWLTKNGFAALYGWINNNGGIKTFIKMASELEPEIKRNFEYREKPKPYTQATAEEKLINAWKKWSKLNKKTKKNFNRTWLIENGFSGLEEWARKNGGIKVLVEATAKTAPRVGRDFVNKVEPISEADKNGESEPRDGDSKKPTRPAGVLPSEMMDLEKMSLNDISPRFRFPKPGASRREFAGNLDDYTADPTELQKIRFAIGQALLTGEWSNELIDKYIEYHSYLPDFIFHHLATQDIVARVKTDQIQIPERILSVAGGAYGNAIAWHRALRHNMPEVVTMDRSERMLDKAKPIITETYGIPEEKLQTCQGDQRTFLDDTVSQFPAGHFSLIECAALDNLKTDDEIVQFAQETAEFLKPNQLLQLVSRLPFPPAMYERLETLACIPLTPRDIILTADIGAGNKLKPEEKKRVQQKTSDGRYYLLAKKVDRREISDTQDAAAMVALVNTASLPAEEQIDAFNYVLAQYPRLNTIPNELLQKYGFRRDVILIRGKSDIIKISRII